MQPNTLTINGSNYRVYTQDGVNFPAGGVPQYALRRVFTLNVNVPKLIDFTDVTGFWKIESVYIDSPEDSEVIVEILNAGNVPFYTDILLRNETPKQLPTVLITNDLKIRVTAQRSAISTLLVYLSPAYVAFSKDFF